MNDLERSRARLDALRRLGDDLLSRLWPVWNSDDALHVFATNAVEGSSMTLGETLAVLQDGITVGGKKLSEHFDIVRGQGAYMAMLRLAKDRARVSTDVLRTLHRVVVGSDEAFAGQWRDHAADIRGSRHTPPNHFKLSELMETMIDRYEAASSEQPVERAAKLHFDLVTIYPFADGNGRTARLLGNLELIRSGFAPILIEPEDRGRYFSILERGQMAGEPGRGDATEFVAYIEQLERKALERYLRVIEVAEGVSFAESAARVGLAPQASQTDESIDRSA